MAQFDSVRGWGKDGWMVVEPRLGKVLFQFFVEVKVSRSCSLRSGLVFFVGMGACCFLQSLAHFGTSVGETTDQPELDRPQE